jgi:hypothetical protein
LIASGHRFSDIQGYTLGQMRGFLQAVVRQEAAMDARLLSLIAIGSRGESNTLEKSLERLQDQSQGRS